LTIARRGFPSRAASRSIAVLAGFALLAFAARVAVAQIGLRQAPVAKTMLSLPATSGFSSSGAVAGEPGRDEGFARDGEGFVPPPEERIKLPTRRDMTILPEEVAHALSSREKVLLGLKESVSMFSIVGWSASAGYSHLINGSPDYGTDKAAFGQRLGATAARSVTDNLFSVALFAPLLHEDPRYYELGAGDSIFKRVIYAATRPLITKTDSGHASVNFSLLAGNLFGSALTNVYYPESNRGFGQTLETFGTSVGGSAFGFVITEFLNDALTAAHLKKVN
jgi:hypothetical protein